jgi:hypothetical protein
LLNVITFGHTLSDHNKQMKRLTKLTFLLNQPAPHLMGLAKNV